MSPEAERGRQSKLNPREQKFVDTADRVARSLEEWRSRGLIPQGELGGGREPFDIKKIAEALLDRGIIIELCGEEQFTGFTDFFDKVFGKRK